MNKKTKEQAVRIRWEEGKKRLLHVGMHPPFGDRVQRHHVNEGWQIFPY
jgi:hypothetical protein